MEKTSTQTSRSVAFLIIIASLVIVSAIIPAKWLGVSQKTQTKPKLDLSLLTSPQEIATDTNKDGNITWREVMTSTLNPSSSTVAELKKIPVDQKSVEELNDPNNLTSSFSKNLYLAAAYLDKNGITDEQSKQDALMKLLQDEKAKIIPTTYSYKELRIAKTESRDSLQQYGNAIAKELKIILNKDTLKKTTYSIVSYSENKDASLLLDTQLEKKMLAGETTKLLSLSVPPSAVVYHLLMLNKIAAYSDTVSAFANADKDPLRATILFQNYPNTILSLTNLFASFSTFFDQKNVVFSSKDPGYVFITGYSLTK